MGKLIYTAIASLDGYVADEHGNWDWSAPDDEVHAVVNDLERSIGTHLYGRRMYEVLVAWETMGTGPDQPDAIRDYAQIWRSADKVVYSTSLEEPASERTRIEPAFDADRVRELKEGSEDDLGIGGPALASQALAAGLVDEIHLFLSPVIVGAGNPALPSGIQLNLELVSERPFGNGVVYLHYRVGTQSPAS